MLQVKISEVQNSFTEQTKFLRCLKTATSILVKNVYHRCKALHVNNGGAQNIFIKQTGFLGPSFLKESGKL